MITGINVHQATTTAAIILSAVCPLIVSLDAENRLRITAVFYLEKQASLLAGHTHRKLIHCQPSPARKRIILGSLMSVYLRHKMISSLEACRKTILAALFAMSMPAALAASPFREDTVMIQKSGGVFGQSIETQIYSPPADGHFPIVVISHGHETGKSALDMRELYRGQALEFVKRGYVVVVPYRTGYSHSGGNGTINASCSTASLGRLWAEDIITAIEYAKQRPDVDPTRIVAIGQSQGGFSTAALGSLRVAGMIGLVNFVGAARQPHCKGGYRTATDAYGEFGKSTNIPALFLYGDNDMYGSAATPDSVPANYLKAYNDAGGHATLYDYGVYGKDSHVMFHHQDALSIWKPPVENFFRSLGLSWDVKYPIDDPYAWDKKKARDAAAAGNELATKNPEGSQ